MSPSLLRQWQVKTNPLLNITIFTRFPPRFLRTIRSIFLLCSFHLFITQSSLFISPEEVDYLLIGFCVCVVTHFAGVLLGAQILTIWVPPKKNSKITKPNPVSFSLLGGNLEKKNLPRSPQVHVEMLACTVGSRWELDEWDLCWILGGLYSQFVPTRSVLWRGGDPTDGAYSLSRP